MHRVYLITHIKQMLMTDPRVGTSDLEVNVPEDGRVVVTGEVSTEAQRGAINEVLANLPQGVHVLNRTHLRTMGPPGRAEAIVTEELP